LEARAIHGFFERVEAADATAQLHLVGAQGRSRVRSVPDSSGCWRERVESSTWLQSHRVANSRHFRASVTLFKWVTRALDS